MVDPGATMRSPGGRVARTASATGSRGSRVRGVFWRANGRGTQELRSSRGKQRGDWWIRWACPHGHLHREQIGPKSVAREESERRRLERPCPARQPKPTSYLLSDVIREYLDATKNQKRSHR